MKHIHLKYKMETGNTAPENAGQTLEEEEYVQWLEEELERRLKKLQEDINIVSWKGQNPPSK